MGTTESRQSARLFPKSSELGSPPLLHTLASVSPQPPLVPGGGGVTDSLAGLAFNTFDRNFYQQLVKERTKRVFNTS